MTNDHLIYIILKVHAKCHLWGDFVKIDLKNLFNASVDNLDIKHTVDLSNLEYSTYYPIKKPVEVNGKVYSRADVVYLDLCIEYELDGVCDRCANEVKRDYQININKILVEELQNEEDDDDYLIVDNQSLDLDEVVNEEVSLSLPSKFLCKDDCKGLCPKCGADLNVKDCDCKPDVDPRMAALLQLLDE